jgi:16S rRNA (adenine1518-N6/adenine1519-N6)-dimethyltransferase
MHIPRKRFGQHFLIDPTVIAAIVRAIAPASGDRMVEIGPGLSALTAPLMQVVKPLHVVEIDRDIVARLLRQHTRDALVVHAGDALEFDFTALARGWDAAREDARADAIPGTKTDEKAAPEANVGAEEIAEAKTLSELNQSTHKKTVIASKHLSNGHFQGINPEKLRLVGNLPYNISTPLLFHFAAHAAVVRDMHFMLQKEVVERMVAAPGSKVFGRLSVMLQVRFAMDSVLDVPPDAFDPPPKVESAVVRMVPQPVPPGLDMARLESIVTAAFGQRRKTVRNALGGLFDEAQLRAHGIDPGARAEDLAVAQYVALAGGPQ